MTQTNAIEIATDTRIATVPVTVRAHRRTVRTVAGQAVVAMLHAWNTASSVAAFKNMQSAVAETLSLAGTPIGGSL